jgi:CheY-like chemotaxis protein
MFRTGAYTGRAPAAVPKLVMLDIKMPKVDGIEVLRRIKADERTRKVPVVVMTSSNEERDVVESYRLGVNSYIVKPVQFESFLATVADIGLYWVITNRVPK